MNKANSAVASSNEKRERQVVPKSLLHDLRIPLNQIIGFSELLAEQVTDDGQTGYLPDIEMIRTAGRNLLGMLGDNFQSGDVSQHANTQLDGLKATPLSSIKSVPEATHGKLMKTDRLSTSTAKGIILIVDDNEMNRAVLSQRLTRQGHEVIMAYDGREALAAMHSQTVDLVLLDIMMPKLDGFAVLKEIKANPSLNHIPVMMVSAFYEQDSVLHCIELGAADYLVKPIDSQLLRARVGACLENKFAHDREMKLIEDLKLRCKLLEEAAAA